MLKTKKFNLNKIKKILTEKGFVIKKKKNNFFLNDFKSFYFTALFSFALILVSTLIPLSVNIKDDINVSKSTIDNNSNVNFQKVLDGKSINQKSIDEGLDLENLFEDILSIEEVPTDTVRLSAATINQLFKDTKYSLDNVRKSKIVKPINLSLLPSEIRNIENTKKKKNLFIKIVLPLILEENNRIIIDRKKLFKILNLQGGAGLIIDYGYEMGSGDTLQAVQGHKFVDILHEPGEADLTAHVNFRRLIQLANSVELQTHGCVTQGAFLKRLGLHERAASLKKAASETQKIQIGHTVERLSADEQMGRLFKVLCVTAEYNERLLKPEGFR